MSHRITSPPETLEAVGKRLQEAMEKRAIGAQALAHATGLSSGTIYYFMRGKREMHLDDLRNIGSVLQVEPSWLAWG